MESVFKTIYNIIWLMTIAFWLATTAWPYMYIYGTVRDCFLNAITTDKIYLVEQNDIIGAPYNFLVPEYSIVRGIKGDVHGGFYFKCSSFSQAEKWLLDHKYNKALLFTRRIDNSESDRRIYKEFFVKQVPNTEVYSVISIVVNYGDDDLCHIPYRYAQGESPVNFNKFRTEPLPDEPNPYDLPRNFSTCVPALRWYSTDGYGSHYSGGHNSPIQKDNNHERVIKQFAIDCGVKFDMKTDSASH